MSKNKIYSGFCTVCGKPCRGKYCSKHYHQIARYGFIKERTRFDKNEITIENNIAKIYLYDNNSNIIGYTIIDKEDIDKIRNYKISKHGKYAYANINNKSVSLHRIVTNTIEEIDKRNNPIDHINGDTLDNRKENLRICTVSENSFNSIKQREHIAGVRRHIQKGKYISYQAYISINKKQVNLGYFKNKEDAIRAREDAEKYYKINPKYD